MPSWCSRNAQRGRSPGLIYGRLQAKQEGVRWGLFQCSSFRCLIPIIYANRNENDPLKQLLYTE